ncbi:MAG: hypothetical protein HKO53_11595 [Gemmatimonadetes bacterium]|nr:hypothetical protein [Gemmatimonadota bacterium]
MNFHEMAAAYVLGTLDPEERTAFETQLAQDVSLRREVASFEETMAAAAGQMVQAPPPSHLRDRVLAEARAARPIRTHSGTRRKRGSTWVPWVLAAAGLAATTVATLAYRAASDREADLAATLAASQDALAERDSLLATFLGPGVRTASLAATGQAPSMNLYWNPDAGRLVMAAYNLPPAQENRVYQLWGIQQGLDPVSLGTFQTGADGRALIAQTVPAGFDFDLSAVTEEPAGGSPQPTSTPFLAGNWSAAQ